MAKAKFTVIKDYDGEIRAYRLGNLYLCKIYTWHNQYSWFILDHYEKYLYTYERDAAELVRSCAEGKKILIERYNKEA